MTVFLADVEAQLGLVEAAEKWVEGRGEKEEVV